jgi:hypothetical protein
MFIRSERFAPNLKPIVRVLAPGSICDRFFGRQVPQSLELYGTRPVDLKIEISDFLHFGTLMYSKQFLFIFTRMELTF